MELLQTKIKFKVQTIFEGMFYHFQLESLIINIVLILNFF